MKKQFLAFASGAVALAACCLACTSNPANSATAAASTDAKPGAGQSAVVDDVSQKNVVQIAVGSADHTTLVAAVKAAELVDALSNAGPFTVFAPTNAAFAALPAGTVEGLLKPDKKSALQDVLQYHVLVGVFKTGQFRDGQNIGTVHGANITMHVNGDKIMVNDANIVASIPASNGVIHVIDKVLLPK